MLDVPLSQLAGAHILLVSHRMYLTIHLNTFPSFARETNEPKSHGHDRISTTLSLFSRLSFPTPVHFLPTCLRHLIKTCAT